MQDASTCEEVVVVPAKSLFRGVPSDHKGKVAVNVRVVHHPIAETAQHGDNGKLVLEWKLIELFSHHSISPKPVVVENQIIVVELSARRTQGAVFVNQIEH